MMWRHVSDSDLMDVLEGTAPEKALGHVQACRHCRARVEEAREGLALTAHTELPEPSPLFWDAQRRRVREGLEGQVPKRAVWWPAASVAAAAALVGVLLFAPRTGPVVPGSSPGAPALPAWSALPPASEDASYEVLEGLGDQMADAAPAAACLDWAGCVAGLSDEESDALVQVLQLELGPEKSL